MGKNKPVWDKNQWQGRSKHQVETNYKLMDITIMLGLICFAGIFIYRLITTF
jgi:hypothetical protein